MTANALKLALVFLTGLACVFSVFIWTATYDNMTAEAAGGTAKARTTIRVDTWPQVTIRHLPEAPGTYQIRVMKRGSWELIKTKTVKRGQWIQVDLDASGYQLCDGTRLGLHFVKVKK